MKKLSTFHHIYSLGIKSIIGCWEIHQNHRKFGNSISNLPKTFVVKLPLLKHVSEWTDKVLVLFNTHKKCQNNFDAKETSRKFLPKSKMLHKL